MKERLTSIEAIKSKIAEFNSLEPVTRAEQDWLYAIGNGSYCLNITLLSDGVKENISRADTIKDAIEICNKECRQALMLTLSLSHNLGEYYGGKDLSQEDHDKEAEILQARFNANLSPKQLAFKDACTMGSLADVKVAYEIIKDSPQGVNFLYDDIVPCTDQTTGGTRNFYAAGISPSHVAIARNDENSLAILKFLVDECKGDPKIINLHGWNLLHVAGDFNQVKVIEYLLSKQVSPNQMDVPGWATPLHDSLHCDSKEAVKILLENGADPKIKVHYQGERLNALELAEKKGLTEIVEIVKPYMQKPEVNLDAAAAASAFAKQGKVAVGTTHYSIS